MIWKNNLQKRIISLSIVLLFLSSTNFVDQTVFSTIDETSNIVFNATPDIYEDDNDFSTAKDIALNTLQNRSISTVGDIDFAKFELDSYYDVEIETNGSSGDTRLWLYGSNEQLLTYDDDSGFALHAQIIGASLPPGIYYIKVDDFADDETIDDYTLSLTASIDEDLFEPDDCSNPAYLAPNSKLKRSIYPIGDVDIIVFEVTTTSNFTVTCSGLTGDTTLLLCYDCSDPIATTIDYDDVSVGDEVITVLNAPPGAYYAIVEDYGNNNEIIYYEIALELNSSETENDLTAPVISDIQTIPTDPLSSQSIEVITSVEDISGLENVTLYYRVNHGTWQEVSMFYAFYTYYFAGIDPLDAGDFVEYCLESSDKSSSHNTAIDDNGGLYYNFTAMSPELYDQFEKDNAFSKGNTMVLNSTIERSINPIGDVDFVHFECIESYDVVIETSENDGDTFLQLYDESQILMISDDDGGTGNLSRIAITLAAGDYTIVITEDGNDTTLNHFNITLMAFEPTIVSEYSLAYGMFVFSVTIVALTVLTKNKKK